MPNWCNNNIELSHPDKAMVERAAKAFWKTPRRLLVSPMKHWSPNTVILTGTRGV